MTSIHVHSLKVFPFHEAYRWEGETLSSPNIALDSLPERKSGLDVEEFGAKQGDDEIFGKTLHPTLLIIHMPCCIIIQEKKLRGLLLTSEP